MISAKLRRVSLSSLHRSLLAALPVLLLSSLSPAQAQPNAGCQTTGSFEGFIASFRQQAASQGVSPRGLAALDGVTFDPAVVRQDRRQGHFRQSFEQFSQRMVPPYRVQKGSGLLKRHAGLLRQIEQRYGVQPAIIVAIWGLETDFGGNMGKLPAIRSIATLAFDCRRSDMFRAQLLDALRVVDRGDLHPSEMRGAWAGEIGQTQFMATSYYRYAVDFDGDGRRDLIRSVPDVLASTANFLKGHGWVAGGSWEPGSANAEVLKQWNRASVYSRTIGYFASRLEGTRAASN
ncbi:MULTISPECIES: lytic murein transglycosylase [unclassified Chelatococcus]|jgi:lytic murein transglycosylase|uniref:lytic murein transglycosylase n=1 Tax=unclassified Chelatococcus TaxID=2638111 RepID=UPI001BD05997|nr:MULTISPECIES: lytic murein transglycosylase [unclassified Chelatococcus]MBS7738459.1 lytic murein transglycosylase [Chelatococcus sp. HY11]MBX3542863.1 lytic murein transglycosylase [Chelatococcus sp.]MCO5077011.1 lytic murein transglycosylase [Chelatococcus sp.]